ncbi:MAG: CHAD domain-containing protein [Hyphomicrobium sp.]|nr:CHAD domain-containing protein [Hyphomicrobium sp.]
MPYRFKHSEKVAKGFRRIAGEQVARALQELTADAVAPSSVHNSRKALKRLRALVRCAAPALGKGIARKHNLALRDIARLLSSQRDLDVSLETIAKLNVHFGSEAAACLAPLRAHIESRAANHAEALDADAVRAIRMALSKEGRRLATARISGRGYTKIIDGVEKTYRGGRAALKTAIGNPTDDTVHELRKHVQAHWRHMGLLSRCWPEEFAARISAARELSELLGDDHDLALLSQACANLSESDAQPIRELCARRQMQLRGGALAAAGRLYAEKPAAFAARISTYWTQGRKIARAAKAAAVLSASLPAAGPTGPVIATGSPQPVAAKPPAKVRSQNQT